MSEMLSVIVAVFLLIFLGTLLRRSEYLDAGFWEAVERLTYFFLFPALLVTTLATAEFADLAALPMALAIIAALIVMTLLLLAIRPLLRISRPAFATVVQGALRQNTYIGLAVSFGLFGAAGLTMAAVAVAALVPLVNVLSVTVLTRFSRSVPGNAAQTAEALAKNPLILACALGLVLNVTGIGLPGFVAPLFEILGRGALAMGLLAVGAGLRFGSAWLGGRSIAIASVLKLMVMPIITALACWLFEVTGQAAVVAILFSGLPTATSAYILTRQMGGDAGLMAGVISVETALSLLTLPILLSLLL